MTDAEINEAVAKALGLTGIQHENAPYFQGRIDAGWATSLDACFRDLVPEARGRGLMVQLYDYESSIGDPMTTMGVFRCEGEMRGSARNDSPSRALCLAWLKTKEVA